MISCFGAIPIALDYYHARPPIGIVTVSQLPPPMMRPHA
jgi:hypothetical protein